MVSYWVDDVTGGDDRLVPHPDLYGINNKGPLVVGDITPDGNSYAGLTATQISDVHLFQSPGSPVTVLVAVNDQGDAVGVYGDPATRTRHGLLYTNGQVVDLNPRLGATWSAARDINNDGVIVGAAVFGQITDPVPWQGFKYDLRDGSVVQLGVLSGMTRSGAEALNAMGDVVGWSEDDAFPPNMRPFLFRDGSLEELTGQPGNAIDINDSRHVVGVAHSGFFYPQQGPGPGVFLWVDGKVEEIPVNGVPGGMNNRDEIVGTALSSSGKGYAWYFSPGLGVVDLNHVLSQSFGLDVQRAYDINEHGQIAASGYEWRDGVVVGHGLVLLPENRFFGNRRVLELLVEIVFGVTQDGGGLARFGNKPVPVGPWGPLSERECAALEQRAADVLEHFIEDPEARQQAKDEMHQILFPMG